MSDASRAARPRRASPGTRRIRPLALVSLTVVWMLLWEHPSVFLVLTGVLVALLVGLVFPLPSLQRRGRFRPLGALRLVGRLLVDLVRSSSSLTALAFRPRAVPRGSIVRVQLRSRSDLYLTQTAELLTLVPGSVVLEARRKTGTLYLYVLGATGQAGTDDAVREVLDAEARVIRAFGSNEEVAALKAGRPQPSRVAAAPDSADPSTGGTS